MLSSQSPLSVTAPRDEDVASVGGEGTGAPYRKTRETTAPRDVWSGVRRLPEVPGPVVLSLRSTVQLCPGASVTPAQRSDVTSTVAPVGWPASGCHAVAP